MLQKINLLHDSTHWLLNELLWLYRNKNENKDKKLYCVATRERFHPKD